MRARGESIRTFCLEGGWRTGLRSFFLSIARHCIVTRNAGARTTYLVQYLLNKSREPGLQRIRTLTLPLGQDLGPYRPALLRPVRPGWGYACWPLSPRR